MLRFEREPERMAHNLSIIQKFSIITISNLFSPLNNDEQAKDVTQHADNDKYVLITALYC